MLSASTSRLRKGLYLDLYSVLYRNAIVHARQKSTLSAINHGLRASKERPVRGRDRSVREPVSRRSEDGKPSRSFARPRRDGPVDGRRSLRPSDARQQQRADRSSAGERRSSFKRKDVTSYRSGEYSRRDSAGRQNFSKRDDGDSDTRSRQARPSSKVSEHNSSGPRILKHTSGEDAGNHVFQTPDINADIQEILEAIQIIQAADDKGTRASLDLVRDTRRRLQTINAAIHEPSATSEAGKRPFPARQFRRRLVEAGVYVRQDEIQDLKAEQTVVLETSEKGRFALLLKGHKAKAVVRPDPALQEDRGDKDESRARRDGRPDTRMANDADVSDRDGARSKIRKTSRNNDDEDDGIPLAVPRTTAASEFLYGANVVLAALRAKRRQLYTLYISNDLPARQRQGHSIPELAKAAGLRVQKVNRNLLDQMSGHRPHNGTILEASKLPAPPVLNLGTPEPATNAIPMTLLPQATEDIAINGTPTTLPAPSNPPRHPFILFLDGITDEGNLGNILRTAHFYSIDAVAIATSTCAPLTSAIMAKASAGACEAVPLLAVPKPSQFIFDSGKAGWKVYAAVAPDGKYETKAGVERVSSKRVGTIGPLARRPCILMLGAEGEGLRANLVNKADYLLSIGRGKTVKEAVDVGVDSLNVSVAAGVLMDAFLRKADSRAMEEEKLGGSDLGF